MNILLTNDDGIMSPGITALVHELSKDNAIYVSAPDRQRSAAGASMSIRTALVAEPYRMPDHADIRCYAVSGTPVDCVRLGFGHLFPFIDAVISGINLGPNRGTDIIYSGTCGAAQEAAIHGYPSLAVSLNGHHDCPFVHFETAAAMARKGLELLKCRPLKRGAYYSINVPDISLDQLKGIRYGHLAMIVYEPKYEKRTDVFGKTVYYECGEQVPNVDETGDTDEYWLEQGYCTVTAVNYDCSILISKEEENEIATFMKGQTNEQSD